MMKTTRSSRRKSSNVMAAHNVLIVSKVVSIFGTLLSILSTAQSKGLSVITGNRIQWLKPGNCTIGKCGSWVIPLTGGDGFFWTVGYFLLPIFCICFLLVLLRTCLPKFIQVCCKKANCSSENQKSDINNKSTMCTMSKTCPRKSKSYSRCHRNYKNPHRYITNQRRRPSTLSLLNTPATMTTNASLADGQMVIIENPSHLVAGNEDKVTWPSTFLAMNASQVDPQTRKIETNKEEDNLQDDEQTKEGERKRSREGKKEEREVDVTMATGQQPRQRYSTTLKEAETKIEPEEETGKKEMITETKMDMNKKNKEEDGKGESRKEGESRNAPEGEKPIK